MYSQILSLCGILAISSLVLAAAPPQARATDHPDKAYFEVEDNVKAHKWKVDLSMVSVSDQARIQTYNKKHRFTLNLPISSTWMVDASLYAPPSQGQKVPDKTAGTPTPTASVWCAFYPQFTNGVTGSANGETFTLLSTFPWVDKQSAGGVVADCGSPGHPNTQ